MNPIHHPEPRSCAGDSPTHRYAVFVDVDQTLVRFPTMVSFMHYLLTEPSTPLGSVLKERRREYASLKELHNQRAPRNLLNRRYYHLFRGCRVDELANAARDWFSEVSLRGDFFIESTRNELLVHQKEERCSIVLVSGSFEPLLQPIAEAIHSTAILCTRLEVVAGSYSGAVVEQLLGAGKWWAVQEYLKRQHSMLADDCFAYGDHISDLPLLERVGHPVVVDGDLEMQHLAKERGWRLLASSRGASPTDSRMNGASGGAELTKSMAIGN